MPWLFYLQGKAPGCLLNRWHIGAKTWSECFGKDMHFFALQGIATIPMVKSEWKPEIVWKMVEL
jgi:hypothetical protein